jgi:DNA polymerase-3 subunit delta'
LIEAQLKLCHDLMALSIKAMPRYFDANDLPAKALPLNQLKDWQQELTRELRVAEHPFNQGLMLESLVSRAQKALSL